MVLSINSIIGLPLSLDIYTVTAFYYTLTADRFTITVFDCWLLTAFDRLLLTADCLLLV